MPPAPHSLAWVIAKGLETLGDAASFARNCPEAAREVGATHRFCADLILALELGVITPAQLALLIRSAPAGVQAGTPPPTGADSLSGAPSAVIRTLPVDGVPLSFTPPLSLGVEGESGERGGFSPPEI